MLSAKGRPFRAGGGGGGGGGGGVGVGGWGWGWGGGGGGVVGVGGWGISLSKLEQNDRPIADAWLRHRMETFSALLAICAGNSPVPEVPGQGQWRGAFFFFFDLRLNKRLSKQSWCWWFETLSRPLWRHRNVYSSMQTFAYSSQFYYCVFLLQFILRTVSVNGLAPKRRQAIAWSNIDKDISVVWCELWVQ